MDGFHENTCAFFIDKSAARAQSLHRDFLGRYKKNS